jgi:hypothetical protein
MLCNIIASLADQKAQNAPAPRFSSDVDLAGSATSDRDSDPLPYRKRGMTAANGEIRW